MIADRLLGWLPGTKAHRRRAEVMRRVAEYGRWITLPSSTEAERDAAVRRIIRESRWRDTWPGRAEPSVDELIDAWAHTLTRRESSALGPNRTVAALRAAADRLLDVAEPDEARAAGEVGRDLATELGVPPELFDELCEAAVPWFEFRLAPGARARAVAAFAAGFAAGVRDRVLAEQERLLGETRDADARRAHDLVAIDPLGFRQVLRASAEPMALLDRQGRFVAVNDAARTLLTIAPDSAGLTGMTLSDCAYTAEDSTVVDGIVDATTSGVTLHVDFAVAWPEGTFKAWVRATLRKHDRDAHDPERICVVLEDTTRITAWIKNLEHARQDHVTALPTRHELLDTVARSLATRDERQIKRTVGMLVVRLDGLRQVRDRFGPRTTHLLLSATATRLTAATAGVTGATVGRLGRETFAVFIDDPSAWSTATSLVRRVRDWVAEPLHHDDLEFRLTPRIGIAEAERGRSTAARLLGRAERSLGEPVPGAPLPWKPTSDQPATAVHEPPPPARTAPTRTDRDQPAAAHPPRPKRSPQRPWSSKPNHAADTPDQINLIAALADSQREPWLHLRYSPVTDVDSDTVRGIHVATWWNHQRLGDIPVDDVVAAGAGIGVDLAVSRWVLRTAIRQAAHWRRAHPTRSTFVQLAVPEGVAIAPDFVDQVKQALTDTGLPADLLRMALPPGAFTPTPTSRWGVAGDLADLGVAVLLDGYGTDFQRYDHLVGMPTTGVVVPPNLNRTLGADSTDRSARVLTHALISAAADLGHEVHLAGITNPIQLHDARLTTATSIEGPLVGSPLPPEDVDALLHAGVAGPTTGALTPTHRRPPPHPTPPPTPWPWKEGPGWHSAQA